MHHQQCFRVTAQFLFSKWPKPLMSTHSDKPPLSEPLGPHFTVLTTAANRAFPASNPPSSCSFLCVETNSFCGWILEILAQWSRVTTVSFSVYSNTSSRGSHSWETKRQAALFFSRQNLCRTPGTHMLSPLQTKPYTCASAKYKTT